jgi:transketolase
VTVEEHTVIGGLGSCVAELLAETDLLGGRRFQRIGIPDVFPDCYGDQNGLMKRYGISAEQVAEVVQVLLVECGRGVPVSAPVRRAA